MAAKVASQFQIDPLVVLDATTEEWLIRIAAAEVVSEAARKAAGK